MARLNVYANECLGKSGDRRGTRTALVVCATLGLLADSAAAEADPLNDVWWTVEHPRFDVYCDIGPKATERFSRRLHETYDVLLPLLGPEVRRDGRPHQYYLLSDDGAYEYFGLDDQKSVGWLDFEEFAVLSVVNASQANADLVARNLFVSILFQPALPTSPRWLHMGIAFYYENAEVRSNKAVVGLPHQKWKDWLAHGQPMTLQYMNLVTNNSLLDMKPERQAVFYAQAWALTHYLIHGPNHHIGRFRRFLKCLGQGQSLPIAFETAYKKDIEDIERGFWRYVQEDSYPRRRIELESALLKGWRPEARELESADVFLKAGALLLARRPQPARVALRQAASARGQNSETAMLLAVALARSGDIERANAEYQRALELDPGNALVRGTYGLMLSKIEDQATLRQAERHLSEATTFLSENYPMLLALARTRAALGLQSEAFHAYERALEVRPWDLNALQESIDVHAACGDFGGARALIDTRLLDASNEYRLRESELALASHFLIQFQGLAGAGLRDSAFSVAQAIAVGMRTIEGRTELAKLLQVEASEETASDD